MNLRDIKKDIEYVIGAFVDDCTAFLTLNPGKDAEQISALIDEAVDLFNGLRDRINAPEGGKKAYFTALRKELLEKTDGMYDRLSEIVKRNYKNA